MDVVKRVAAVESTQDEERGANAMEGGSLVYDDNKVAA